MTTTTRMRPIHDIGALDDFPDRKVVPVEIDGRTFGLLRNGAQVFVFANRCPHHGAPMCHAQVAGSMRPSERNQYEYELEGLVVKCPWHAYEFDVRSGRSMGDIIRAKLPVFATEIRDGRVLTSLARVG